MGPQLDLLEEVRATTEQTIAHYQNLMAKNYNTKVKPYHFQVGDLVLRKVTTVTRDPAQGKLGSNWEGLIRSSTTIEKGLTTLRPSMGKNSITHGIPST